jgi:hypothetical protein
MKIIVQRDLHTKQIKVVSCAMCDSELGLFMDDLEAYEIENPGGAPQKFVRFTCAVPSCGHTQNVDGISYNSVKSYKQAQKEALQRKAFD